MRKGIVAAVCAAAVAVLVIAGSASGVVADDKIVVAHRGASDRARDDGRFDPIDSTFDEMRQLSVMERADRDGAQSLVYPQIREDPESAPKRKLTRGSEGHIQGAQLASQRPSSKWRKERTVQWFECNGRHPSVHVSRTTNPLNLVVSAMQTDGNHLLHPDH